MHTCTHTAHKHTLHAHTHTPQPIMRVPTTHKHEHTSVFVAITIRKSNTHNYACMYIHAHNMLSDWTTGTEQTQATGNLIICPLRIKRNALYAKTTNYSHIHRYHRKAQSTFRDWFFVHITDSPVRIKDCANQWPNHICRDHIYTSKK